MFKGDAGIVVNRKRDFDLEATTWDEKPHRVTLDNDLFTAIAGTVALTHSLEVFDFGCGTGLLTLQLAAQAGHVTGSDSSRTMLDVLARKAKDCQIGNITTYHIDAACVDAIEGRYDLVTSTMTLHHVRDIAPLLEQFFRILRPGGHVCIADLDLENGDFHGNNEDVFHFGFDRGLLQETLSAAGFVRVRNKKATEVHKTGSDGQVRSFSVFLITGQRREACITTGGT